MLLLFSISLPSEAFMQALAWTFIHSLWQGMLLSIAAVGIIFLTKKASASLRYNLLTVALLLFVLSIIVSFSSQLAKAKETVQVTQIIPAKEITIAEQAIVITNKNNELSITTKFTSFVTANANWIILIWFLIIGFQFIRLAVGLYNVQQIKKTQVFSVGDYWNNRIMELSKQLHISTAVRLLQSGIAKIPVAIGFLNPVILFPVAMLASLPANEIEAILMHELAHIKRKDFLVNLLQSIVEIIFFFNPAVLWVSGLIKIERENCCDDIAVDYTGSKQNYIKALLSFQEYNLPAEPLLATAFAGEKNHLLDRVKRIIYNNNKTLNNMEKKFLAAGIIITSVCVFTFFTSNAQKIEEKVAEKIVTETIPNSSTKKVAEELSVSEEASTKVLDANNVFSGRINTVVNGKKYIIVSKNNQIKELYVDDKKIATEKIDDYKAITDKIMQQTKIDLEQSRKDLAQSKIDLEQSKKDMSQSKIDMEQSNRDMEKSKRDMEKSLEDQKQSKRDMEQSKRDMEQSKKDMEQSRIDMEQSKRDMEQSRIDMAQSRIDMEQSRKDMEQSRILQEKIIEDFISEHIISNKKELNSYKINNNELIVNGIKQSDAIHKRIKEKYAKGDKWTTIYNHSEVESK
jgi:bla regulator protein blaR1